MTVHEAKLIQTFPADYRISGSWGEAMRQIGNAVPVRLAEKMGRCMVSALSRNQSETASSNGRMTVYRRAPVQLRLAIENQKGYRGAVKPKPKLAAKTVRQKSVKARYSKKR